MGEYPKVSTNSKHFWIFSQLWWGNIQKYPYFLSSREAFANIFSKVFECIQTYRDASECIWTGPGRSQQLQKLPKTWKKIVKTSKDLGKFWKKILRIELLGTMCDCFYPGAKPPSIVQHNGWICIKPSDLAPTKVWDCWVFSFLTYLICLRSCRTSEFTHQ